MRPVGAMYAGDMIGRSLLAVNDKEQRDILLADTYTGLKYFFRDRGELLCMHGVAGSLYFVDIRPRPGLRIIQGIRQSTFSDAGRTPDTVQKRDQADTR